MSFEHLPQAWQTRLVVMRDVFPWVTPAIKELAGLEPNDGLSSPESAVAFIAAHGDYMRGVMASNPKAAELHHRQNAEWEQITGIGPLGTPADWRAAGYAAGAPAETITRCDVESLARYVIPWAIAKRLASDTTRHDTKDDTPKKSRKIRTMNAKSADCARLYRANKGKTPLKTIVEDYVDKYGGSVDSIIRILNDNPDQWKGDTDTTF